MANTNIPFWKGNLNHFDYYLGRKTENLYLNLKNLIGTEIVDVGFHPSASEGGLSVDYRKDGKLHRIVLGFNDLGMWEYWQGELPEQYCEQHYDEELKNILKLLREKNGEEIDVERIDQNRIIIFNTTELLTGDHVVTILKRKNSSWTITDEGNSGMSLFSDLLDGESADPNFKDSFGKILNTYGIKDINGELIIQVSEEKFSDALLSFTKAIEEIKKTVEVCWNKMEVPQGPLSELLWGG